MKHGKSNTRLYRIWSNMKDRCYNPNCRNYKHYGGRGIVMCDEWRHDFSAFYEWSMATGYDETAPRGQFTIERNDNNGPYSPDNCRWATIKEQENNKRSNRLVTINGVTKTLSQWCEELNANYRTELYHQVKDAILQKKREKRRSSGMIPQVEYSKERRVRMISRAAELKRLEAENPSWTNSMLAEKMGMTVRNVQRLKRFNREESEKCELTAERKV